MYLFDLSAVFQASLALAVVAGMFGLFMREIYPTEVVAITGGAVFYHRCFAL